MEPAVVDAILFAYLEIIPPLFHRHRRVCGEGEYTGIVFAAQKGGLPVDGELRFLGLELSQPEVYSLAVISF